MALFKNDNPTTMANQRSGAPVPPGQVNIIGHGTVIEGGLNAKSDVRISGKVIGNVNVEGKTVVTPEGVVEGEVRSTHADVAGRIDGELFVQDRLVLKESAVVEGNIHTAKLVIEDGAKFSGTCEMEGTRPKPSASKPPSSPASKDDVSESRRTDRPAAASKP